MALTTAQRRELDAYKAEIRAELQAENARNQGTANGPQPQLPDVPELELPDVLRILVQHSRIPLEATQLACLAAIDRAFEDTETDDVEDDVEDEPATDPAARTSDIVA